MLEKLFLASILTFSFGLFADIGWFNHKQDIVQEPAHDEIVSTLAQNYKNIKIDADNQ